MQKMFFWLPILLLSACANGGPMGLDGQKFLSSLEGPKVPTIQDTLLESAKNAEKQGDYKQAAVLYQQILEKQPEHKDAMLGLAEANRRLGNYDQAIIIYDVLLKKDPTSIGAKEGKGLALMSKGDFDTPGKLFDEVMKADAKRWKTLNALGILFTMRNLHTEAQQYYNEALKHSPENPSVINNMGLSLALDRKYDAAEAALLRGSNLTASGTAQHKHLELNLALVYAIDNKLDDARAIAQNYYTGPSLDNNMGLYAHLANNDQLAKAYLNMALTESKTYYGKAWDNLQALSETSPSAAKPEQVAVKNETSTDAAEKKKDKKTKPQKKTSSKTKDKPAVVSNKPAPDKKDQSELSTIVGSDSAPKE